MPTHLFTIPSGAALPSPTGLPEGYPFRHTTENVLYVIEGGAFVAQASLLAADLTFTPAGTVAATTVQAAIEEVASEAGTGVSDHLADATDAHDASAISFAPAGTVAATNVQAAIEEVASEAGTGVSDHLADAADAHDATAISFTPAGSIAATDVQAAVEEVASEAATATGTVASDLANHLSDGTDAHDATAVSFAPAGTIAATTVQAAVEEVASEAATALSDHLTDPTDAHDASAVSFAPTGALAATDVQAALAELDTEKAPRVETVNVVAAAGAAETLLVGWNRVTLDANCTFTFPAAAAGTIILLELVQDGTGGWTATWPGTVKWPAATAPTLTVTAAKADEFAFRCYDGTNWNGEIVGQNY